SGQVIIKRFSKENCRINPCLNGGTCVPGHCRNIYKSCDRWAMEDKCELVRSQTNFFDMNCAVSCHTCTPKPDQQLSEIPIPPALEPLQFMVGKWHSLAAKGLRYPTDMYSNSYEEVFDVIPAEVPMSTSRSGNDTRITQAFLTLKTNSNPTEVAVLSTGNEGLNMVELGTVDDHMVMLNISYMQVHPSLDSTILPLGATRRFRMNGQFLEMTVAKLFPDNKVSQFKKMFRKTKDYPL
ncbi:unnamed protein product, partial [Anisakis simplex]|uniref:Protein male abnormal 7 (inferred by orthology to a C. elegans protein) n=1 Tax=Anisakis simplex TaxID=6269 RepID=A0A0M3JX54_ANISI